jgi:DNA-binding NarL/FixJ family response regulator
VDENIRILLADAHPAMRRSLRELLDREVDLEVVAEAGELPDALRQILVHQPDVLVLDLGLPDGNSLQAIGRLTERAPETPVIAMSMQAEPSFARAAMLAGAKSFVLKEMADSSLPQAIRTAFSEGRSMS